MSVNKLSMARVAVGSLLVGSAPGKKNAPFNASPVEVAGIREASKSLTPGAITSATVYTTTITATGIQTSDAVVVIPPNGVIAGVTWSAYVSAANTITLRIANGTGSSITVAAGTWTFLCFNLPPNN